MQTGVQSEQDGSSNRRLLITVHGIRTFGGWQEQLERLVAKQLPEGSIQFINYKYGYFSVLAFIIPFFRWLVIRKFRKELIMWCHAEKWDRIDLVGHSFGTHVLAWALHGIPKTDRPQIHTILLSGSVLRGSFPWRDLVGNSVERVVNDCGSKDNVLVVNQLFVLFTGMAGRAGFSGATHVNFRNRFFEFGHSGYFYNKSGQVSDDWMKSYWLPLLSRDEPVALYDERKPPSVIDGIFQTFANNAEPIKLTMYLLPVVLGFGWVWGLYVGEAEARNEADKQASIAREQTEVANQRNALLSIDAAALLRQNGSLDEALLLLIDASKEFSATQAPDKLLIELQNSIDEALARPRYRFGVGSYFAHTNDGPIVFDTRSQSVYQIRKFNSIERLFSYDQPVRNAKIFENGSKVTIIGSDWRIEILDLETGVVDATIALPPDLIAEVSSSTRILPMERGKVIFETTIDDQTGWQTDVVVLDAYGSKPVRKSFLQLSTLHWFSDSEGWLTYFAPTLSEFQRLNPETNKFETVSEDAVEWEHRFLCLLRTSTIGEDNKEFLETTITWQRYSGNYCIEHREDSILYQEHIPSSAGGQFFYYVRNDEEILEPVEVIGQLDVPGEATVPFLGFPLNAIDYWDDGARILINYNREIFVFDREKLLLWEKLPNPVKDSGFTSENQIFYILEAAYGLEVRLANLANKSTFLQKVEADELNSLEPLNKGSCTGYTQMFDNTAIASGGWHLNFGSGATSGAPKALSISNEELGVNEVIPIAQADAKCVQVNADFSKLLILTDGAVEVYDLGQILSSRRLSDAYVANIVDDSISVSAFFVGASDDIVTAHWDNRVVRWSQESGKYVGRQLMVADFPVRYAEPSSDGSRLIYIADLGFGEVTSFLHSLDAGAKWLDLASGYKWIGVAFDENEDVVYRSTSISEYPSMKATIPTLSELADMARGALSFGCELNDGGLAEESPCWPDLVLSRN